jgi:hypothetical protein
MKIQISRDGFRPDKRYSGVYQQQGRMITDRDWNELVDILKSRLDEGLADAVGSGLPRRRGVQIAKGGSGGLAIQPGVVYAGGVAARVTPMAGAALPFRFDQQADFPAPPDLPSGRAYVLYADIWERPVLALEDGELRDPALNGADTTARTRTMAQIKWAASPFDPENPAQNPPRGNGILSVSVPARGTADPAAAVDPAGGDFLLRVEVHEVQWSSSDPAQPGRLVIKWSRENGAEAHRALEAPSSFKAGQWAYEIFKQESDLHLGYHAPSSWLPVRGKLYTGFPMLNPQTEGDSLVRRWDGSCVLYRNGNSWGFSPNAPEDPAKTAPGAAVTLDASGRLNVRLIDLELALDLQGKVLLPGDFWQVPVRRAIHQPGDRILQATPPSGIAHRYVTLANVSATGDVTPALRTFSSLSELEAADVRYDGSGCQSGLYNASHDTVKKALDRLWVLGAEHAAYVKPADTSVYQGKTVATVKDALNLLGDVRARQIVFEGRTGVPHVQTAVDELFARANGDANGFTVGGSGAEFPNVVTALQTLLAQGRRDIRLVLLPGDHELDTTILFTPNATAGATHLTLVGSGWTSRLLVRRPATFLDFSSVTFQALAIEFNPEAYLELWNCEINLLDNRIAGFSKEGLFRPVTPSRLLVRDNIVEVTAQDYTVDPVSILVPLDAEATVRELFSTRAPRLFTLRAQAIVDKLRALSAAQRSQRVLSIEGNLERSPGDFQRGAYNDLVANIRQGGGPDARAIPLLATIRQQALQWAGAGVFLQNRLPGYPIRLESNQIFGTVSLYGAPGAELSSTDLSVIAGRLAGSVGFDPTAAFELIATGNRMSGFVVGADMLNVLRSTTPIMPLFQRMALSDNTFDSGQNQIAAVNVELNGNMFTTSPFGWIVAEEILAIGNVARNDVAIDVATRNLVQAGNSAHVRVRPATPALPK